MVKFNFDVIILGAGPAGLAAAASLQVLGLSTVIIDYAKAENRSEGWIESIHPGVVKQLEYLNIAKGIEMSFRGTYCCISDGIKTKSLNPYSDEIWYGHHICKTSFNLLLRNNVRETGVLIKECHIIPVIDLTKTNTVNVSVSGEEYNSRFLIDATGRKRFGSIDFGRSFSKLAPDCLVLSGIQDKTNKQFGKRETAYFIPLKNKWFWLGLLDDGRQCWTAVFKKRDWKSSRSEELPVDLQTASRWANIAWEFGTQSDLSGLLSCGESAALLDPASGKGIFHAVESGVMVSKAINEIIKYPSYEKEVKSVFENWVREQHLQMTRQLKDSYNMLGVQLE